MRTPGSIGVSGDAIGVTGPCSRVGDMRQGSRTAPRRGATLAALVGAGRVGRVVGRVVIAMAAVAAALALAPAAGAADDVAVPARRRARSVPRAAADDDPAGRRLVDGRDARARRADPRGRLLLRLPHRQRAAAVNADLARTRRSSRSPATRRRASRSAAASTRRCTASSRCSRSPPATRSRGRAAPPIAYAGVRAAWREYLRRFNRGRGVVLIGHSQGTFLLRTLVRREIDPSAAQRRAARVRPAARRQRPRPQGPRHRRRLPDRAAPAGAPASSAA